MGFGVQANYRVEVKESDRIEKYLELAAEVKKKKAVEHEGDSNTNCNWRTWNGP